MRLCIAAAGIAQIIFNYRKIKNDYSGKENISAYHG